MVFYRCRLLLPLSQLHQVLESFRPYILGRRHPDHLECRYWGLPW
jgi:hypothetical protein